MKKAFLVLEFIALFGFSGNAYALLFDFAGATSSGPSYAFTADGLTLTATATADGAGCKVHRDADGLGVTYVGDHVLSGSAGKIDGYEKTESLYLTFDRLVDLNSVTFSLISSSDYFRLLVNGVEVADEGIPSNRYKSFASGDRTGRVFEFTVSKADDDYKIRSIDISAAPIEAAVPEFGSALLFGAGLIGFARRKPHF